MGDAEQRSRKWWKSSVRPRRRVKGINAPIWALSAAFDHRLGRAAAAEDNHSPSSATATARCSLVMLPGPPAAHTQAMA